MGRSMFPLLFHILFAAAPQQGTTQLADNIVPSFSTRWLVLACSLSAVMAGNNVFHGCCGMSQEHASSMPANQLTEPWRCATVRGDYSAAAPMTGVLSLTADRVATVCCPATEHLRLLPGQ